MKAVLTKSIPPTGTLPARVKAYDLDGKSIVLSREMAGLGAKGALTFDEKLEPQDTTPEYRAHCFTAWEFVTQHGWIDHDDGHNWTLGGGAIKDGFAWVLLRDRTED